MSPAKNLNSLRSKSLRNLRSLMASLCMNSMSWKRSPFFPYPEAKWQLIKVIHVESIYRKSMIPPLCPELPLNPVLISCH